MFNASVLNKDSEVFDKEVERFNSLLMENAIINKVIKIFECFNQDLEQGSMNIIHRINTKNNKKIKLGSIVSP